jgi:hypothetical protein
MPSSTVTGRMLAASKRHPSTINVARIHEVEWREVFHTLKNGEQITGCCFVYFIGELDGPLKIGYAKDPIARLRAMQTGNPRPLKLERVLFGDRLVEKVFHENWEPYAIVSATNVAKPQAVPGTEWFRPEIREHLFPIVETAKHMQTSRIFRVPIEPFSSEDLVQVITAAHVEHGHVKRVPDRAEFLAAESGYVGRRTERLTD